MILRPLPIILRWLPAMFLLIALLPACETQSSARELAFSGEALPSGGERKSQPAKLSQRIGDAEVTLLYNRPVARGRELFGGLVPFGEIWNPGADEATRIELSHDFEVAGHRLPAGKYSIWAIPGREEWTLAFSRAWDVPHVPYPEGEDALRVALPSRTGPHMEALGFYFPVVEGDSAVLNLHWGTTVLPIRLHRR